MNSCKSIVIACLLHPVLAWSQQCPFGPEQRELLREAANRHRTEATWIVGSSSQGDAPSRAFARNLLGSTASHMGVATLIEQCSGPRTFEATCEPCEGGPACPATRRCLQLGCEQARVDTARLWWEPSRFAYRSDQPYFANHSVRYEGEPQTTIRYDGTQPGQLTIYWIGGDDAQVLVAGRELDARNTVIGRGQRAEGAPVFAEMQSYYPALAAGGITRLALRIDRLGVLGGSIMWNADTLAYITESANEEDVVFAWFGACSEAPLRKPKPLVRAREKLVVLRAGPVAAAR